MKVCNSLKDIQKNTDFTHAGSAVQTNRVRTKSFGFTLAEVLITLGIIGVVAAITIPGLVANQRARVLETQFLKSYATLQLVFRQMQADEISLDPIDYPNGTFYKTVMNYLSAPYDCGRGGYWGKVAGNNKGRPCYKNITGNDDTPYKTLNGKSDARADFFDDGQIALQNGSLLMFENNTSGKIYVSVDLNGYNNRPNRWGYDLFTFQFKEGELLPMGNSKTDYPDAKQYCSLSSGSNINGITCAALAQNDPEGYFKDVVKNAK